MKTYSGFWLSLLFNMLFNIEWTVPAWVLLIIHFVLDWPIWLFAAALFIWLAVMVCWTSALMLISKASNEPPVYRENKNPYSSGPYKKYKKGDENNS